MTQELFTNHQKKKKKRLWSEDFLAKLHHRLLAPVQGILLGWAMAIWYHGPGQITCGKPFQDIAQSQVDTQCLSNIVSNWPKNEADHFG